MLKASPCPPARLPAPGGTGHTASGFPVAPPCPPIPSPPRRYFMEPVTA